LILEWIFSIDNSKEFQIPISSNNMNICVKKGISRQNGTGLTVMIGHRK